MGNLRQKYTDEEWEELQNKHRETKKDSVPTLEYNATTGTQEGVFQYNSVPVITARITKCITETNFGVNVNSFEIKNKHDEVLTLTAKELNDLVRSGKLQIV